MCRPSWVRATRLAPTIQPSADTATMPSATLPMPSGSRCRCRRMLRLQVATSRRFSIMRTAVLTKPRVWAWPLRWSPEMSRMPSSSPVAERMGEAAQVRKLLRSRKCSPPCTSTAMPSASAVPMALVPRWDSCHEAPQVSATRSALSTKPGLPSVCMSMPARSASTTTLWLWRTWSNRYSMMGRECVSRLWLQAMASRSSPGLDKSAAARPAGARPAAMLRPQERARRSSTRPVGQWPCSSRCRRACCKASRGDGVVRMLSPERASWHPLRRGSMAGCERRGNSVCTGKLSNCSIS